MTQFAIVRSLPAPERALVEIMRGTACGDSCGSCEVCKYTSKISVEAENGIYAAVGDRVEIETGSKRILGAAMLVYVVPFILFFLGYALASALGMAQGGCILMSFAFFAVGLGIAVIVGRRQGKKPIVYTIKRILDTGDGV